MKEVLPIPAAPHTIIFS